MLSNPHENIVIIDQTNALLHDFPFQKQCSVPEKCYETIRSNVWIFNLILVTQYHNAFFNRVQPGRIKKSHDKSYICNMKSNYSNVNTETFDYLYLQHWFYIILAQHRTFRGTYWLLHFATFCCELCFSQFGGNPWHYSLQTPSNILVLNLAVADFLCGLFTPFQLSFYLSDVLLFSDWLLVCLSRFTFMYWANAASFFFLNGK